MSNFFCLTLVFEIVNFLLRRSSYLHVENLNIRRGRMSVPTQNMWLFPSIFATLPPVVRMYTEQICFQKSRHFYYYFHFQTLLGYIKVSSWMVSSGKTDWFRLKYIILQCWLRDVTRTDTHSSIRYSENTTRIVFLWYHTIIGSISTEAAILPELKGPICTYKCSGPYMLNKKRRKPASPWKKLQMVL